MTIYYVRPTVGNDANGGTTWADDSWATLKKATDTVAAGAHVIVMDTANADVITADTTYNIQAGVTIVSSANGTSYTAGATVSTTTAGVDVTITGTAAIWGLTFALGTSTHTNWLNLANANSLSTTFIDCAFQFNGSNTDSGPRLGSGVAENLRSLQFINCSWSWTATGQGFARVSCPAVFINNDFSAGSTHPSTLIEVLSYTANIEMIGCDLSDIGTVFEAAPSSTFFGYLRQCKLKASATIFAPTNYCFGEVFVYDCNSGDVHISLGHYTYTGNTTISTSVYASDNIADSNLSWVVSGSAAATKATPYESPWIDVYHTGTSAITPYLEVLRSGSTTSYLEGEAWINVLAKTTSGSTRATQYTNRANPLDTTSDNTDSFKGAGDWTGEHASDNWYGKLILNSSITPAEAGHIRARVGVAGEYTLYVDPQIRGLS